MNSAWLFAVRSRLDLARRQSKGVGSRQPVRLVSEIDIEPRKFMFEFTQNGKTESAPRNVRRERTGFDSILPAPARVASIADE